MTARVERLLNIGQIGQVLRSVMWHSGGQIGLRTDLRRETRIRQNRASTDSDPIELWILLYAAILMQPLRTVGLPEHLMIRSGVQARFVLDVIIVIDVKRLRVGLGLVRRLPGRLIDRRQVEIALQ